MKNKLFLIIIYLLLSLFVIFSYLNIVDKSLSANNDSEENKLRNMIIDTADAYYRKRKYYQYDLYRENRYMSPESINSYNNSYAVCSTFVFQIYYNTLGINIPIKSSNHISNSSYAIQNNIYSDFFKRYNINKDSTKIDDFISTSYDFVKPGDLIVFTLGNNGHTTMVYKKEIVNGTKKIEIIHNNGKVYNFETFKDEIEENGSLLKNDLKEFLNKNVSAIPTIDLIKIINTKSNDVKYLTYKTDGNNKIITENNVPSVSGKASEIRYKYKSMDLTKTHKIIKDDCSVSTSIYADLNDYIEYTIEVKNNSSSDYTGMKFIENIDTSKVDFVSSTGVFDSSKGTITFKDIKVKAGTTSKLTYKVRVKDNSSLLGNTIESTGTLNDKLKTKKILLYIGNTLSHESQALLESKYKTISADSSDVSGKKYVKQLYKEALGYDLNISDNVIVFDSSVNKPVNNTAVKSNNDIVVANLYGLKTNCTTASCNTNVINIYNAWRYQVNNNGSIIVNTDVNSFDEYNNRPRTLTKEMLETGDIIYSNGVAFIYINGALIKNKEIHYEKKIADYLNNLVGNNYVVLRPSLSRKINKKTYKIEYKTNELNVTNLPKTTKYTYSKIDNCKTKLSTTVPKRTGYTFNGWLMNKSDNTNAIWQSGTSWPQSNAKDYVLYTTWKPNQYKITYDLNGAEGSIEPTTYTYNEEGTTKITNIEPKRTNYIFSGWSMNKTDSKGKYPSSTPWKLSNAGNYTLYAIWIANSDSSEESESSNLTQTNDNRGTNDTNNESTDKNELSNKDETQNIDLPKTSEPIVIDNNQDIKQDDNNQTINDNEPTKENNIDNTNISENNNLTSENNITQEEKQIVVNKISDDIEVKYEKLDNKKYKIVIKSNDKPLKEKQGYELSNDKLELSKVTDKIESESITVTFENDSEEEIIIDDETITKIEKQFNDNKKNNNNIYYIIIGVLLLLIGIVVYLKKRKRI